MESPELQPPATIDPSTTRIGWIGTGVMGSSMCTNLLKAGFKNVAVHNRTLSKCQPLVKLGAVAFPSPAALAKQCDVVFSIVGHPADVREVILAPETGALHALKPGAIICDMTTSKPSLAQEIEQAARARGIHALDAPVSGGDVGARNGTLSIMVGGSAAAFEALRPAFEAMGKMIRHMGDAGYGQVGLPALRAAAAMR